ncbi:hypothetical protein NHE_0485 [Neorickettsia helminthoeca str. Oregon]|uniref:Uncharacterized protein n=1 Tax=Neorickettsia helminthoeca str. Oregon TaxID=1286528 RepID=X5GWK3_9RICK|nr:hypothetical protein [Neorickettsia helminthoeca]AHX11427.1 hypothetical protein NHE_0485 [Neorickettsia helminthoeca str. Oregon]
MKVAPSYSSGATVSRFDVFVTKNNGGVERVLFSVSFSVSDSDCKKNGGVTTSTEVPPSRATTRSSTTSRITSTTTTTTSAAISAIGRSPSQGISSTRASSVHESAAKTSHRAAGTIATTQSIKTTQTRSTTGALAQSSHSSTGARPKSIIRGKRTTSKIGEVSSAPSSQVAPIYHVQNSATLTSNSGNLLDSSSSSATAAIAFSASILGYLD